MQQKPGMIRLTASVFSVLCICLPALVTGQDIAFEEEYYISHGQREPDPEQDKIIFFEDGTYTRAEYTGNRIPDPEKFAQRIFYIDDLRGHWEWKDGHLQLFDAEILECRCRIVTKDNPAGVEEPCDIAKDDITFGAAEWYEGFRAEFHPGRILKLESLNAFWERTGRK